MHSSTVFCSLLETRVDFVSTHSAAHILDLITLIVLLALPGPHIQILTSSIYLTRYLGTAPNSKDHPFHNCQFPIQAPHRLLSSSDVPEANLFSIDPFTGHVFLNVDIADDEFTQPVSLSIYVRTRNLSRSSGLYLYLLFTDASPFWRLRQGNSKVIQFCPVFLTPFRTRCT